MAGFVTPHLTEMVVAIGTKFGKSLAGGGAMTVAAPIKRQALFRWVAPIYSQSRIGYNYMRRMLPPEPFIAKNDSDLTLRFRHTDTIIQCFHGRDAESLEGEGVSGYVIDEAAKMKRAVYDSAKTTTTLTRGPIILMSTPRGKNWFYKKYLEGVEEMARAKFENRPPRMVSLTAMTADNPFVPRESIEEARAKLTARLFRQYYEASFEDDGEVFEGLAYAFGGAVEYSVNETWLAPEHDSNMVFIGADWAKTKDYSCFIALNQDGRMIGYDWFNKMPYPDQVERLYKFIRDVKARSTVEGGPTSVDVLHDQNGVGEAINDIIDATNTYGWRITGLKWGNAEKELLVTGLQLSLDEKQLSLYAWHTLRTEMDSFEVNTSSIGNPIYSAPEGGHDDTVMSLVLANKLYRELRAGFGAVIVADSVNQTLRRIAYSGGQLYEGEVG